MTQAHPSRAARARATTYHAARILFLPWPRYTFDDLAAVQDSLDGPAFRGAAARMRAHPDGRALLDERPKLGIRTVDWHALSLLPLDSLGYNLWHHFHANGLLREVPLGPPLVRWDAETEFIKDRYRATHDLRHVMLGLGVDGWEEIVLQAFQCAELPQKLSALIVVFGGLKHMLVDGRWREILTMAPKAWRAGRASHLLLNLPAERLWATPLDEVRRAYGITPVGDRYPVQQRHPDAGTPAANPGWFSDSQVANPANQSM